MVRTVGAKNKQPSKDELRRLLDEKDIKEGNAPEPPEEKTPIPSPDKIIDDADDSIFEDNDEKPDIKPIKENKYYNTDLMEALGVEIEPEPDPPKIKIPETKPVKELKRQIQEYYKEFSHKLQEKDLDNMNEDDLKEELLSCKNLISKKNADSLIKYSIIAFSGFIEYISITRFDAPMQGYQKNISNNDSLDDIIKEIKIKYGFNKLDNILSPEFRLLFLMIFTGYQTISINKNLDTINKIKDTELKTDVMNKLNDL